MHNYVEKCSFKQKPLGRLAICQKATKAPIFLIPLAPPPPSIIPYFTNSTHIYNFYVVTGN